MTFLFKILLLLFIVGLTRVVMFSLKATGYATFVQMILD